MFLVLKSFLSCKCAQMNNLEGQKKKKLSWIHLELPSLVKSRCHTFDHWTFKEVSGELESISKTSKAVPQGHHSGHFHSFYLALLLL